MKKTILTLNAILIATMCAHSQNSYEWNLSENPADWGSFGGWTTSNGNYTHDFNINGTGPQGSTIYGTSAFNEAPYDNIAGLIRTSNGNTVYTRTDPNAAFDLSATGSSAVIRMVNHFVDFRNTTGKGTLSDNHLFEFGLTSNSTFFGGTGDDSVFIGAKMDTAPHNQLAVSNYDINLFTDETSDANPSDGTWDMTPVTNLASNLTYQAISTGGSGAKQAGVSVLSETRYTNLGGGQMRVDYSFTELNATGPTGTDTVTPGNVFAGSHTFTHNLADLSALNPAFGVRHEGGNIPNSGGTYDWNPEYESLIQLQIPEPSSSLLVLLGAASCLVRRRR